MALFKRQSDGSCRVSLRSKPAVDVRGVASKWGGGGHRNAAGATLAGSIEELKAAVVAELKHAIDAVGDAAQSA